MGVPCTSNRAPAPQHRGHHGLGGQLAFRRRDCGAWSETLPGGFDNVPGGMPYSFVGALGVRTDADTALRYMRQRWYDPTLQRFISRDPIGLRGGANLYAYADGNPSTWNDPDGLLARPPAPAHPAVVAGSLVILGLELLRQKWEMQRQNSLESLGREVADQYELGQNFKRSHQGRQQTIMNGDVIEFDPSRRKRKDVEDLKPGNPSSKSRRRLPIDGRSCKDRYWDCVLCCANEVPEIVCAGEYDAGDCIDDCVNALHMGEQGITPVKWPACWK